MLTKVPMSFPPYGGKEKIEKLLGKLTDIALSRPYFFFVNIFRVLSLLEKNLRNSILICSYS